MQSAKGGGAIPQQYTGKAQRFSPCVALSPCVARKGGKILGKTHQSLKRQSLKRQSLKRKHIKRESRYPPKSKFPKIEIPQSQKSPPKKNETVQGNASRCGDGSCCCCVLVVVVVVVVISVRVLKL